MKQLKYVLLLFLNLSFKGRVNFYTNLIFNKGGES